ncbi:hypothetical protein RCL1_007419 [Eukaryota sp. TZLM3-RCL]
MSISEDVFLKFPLDPGITKLYELKEAQQLLKSKSCNVAKTLLKRLEDSGKNLSISESRKTMSQWFKENNTEQLELQLMNLQSQSEAMRSVKMNDSDITNSKYKWLSMLIDLPPSVLKFGMNGILNTVPTANNLILWKIERKMPDGNKIVSSQCLLCGHDNATLGHVLSKQNNYPLYYHG